MALTVTVSTVGAALAAGMRFCGPEQLPAPRSVLVVDDDAGVRDVVERVLQEEGFMVTTAANGWQALDRIAAQRPDVVLLDLQLPMLSGWGVLQQLRARNIAVPVVFMTAGYRAAEEAAKHHVAGYLAKPFNLDELVAVVERVAALPVA